MAGAKASVTLPALSALLARGQRYVRDRRERYETRYERVTGPEDRRYYLTEKTHWAEVGEALDLGDRETDALRRVHAAQFRRAGRRLDRLEEFETTLEIRDVVVFGPGDGDGGGSESEPGGSNDTTLDQDTGSEEEEEKGNGKAAVSDVTDPRSARSSR